MRTRLSLAIATVALAATSVLAQVNQAAIDDVASGAVKTARASWWGFDSGAEKVVVEDMGSPWIVDQIQLASNQELALEDGAIIEAKRGAFKGTGDSLLTAAGKENVALIGYGATLRMHKADYQGDEYDKGEWRHCLSIRGCTNAKIHGLTLEESGGDGIYLGVWQAGVTNANVHIKDVKSLRHHRQGISVITAENLLIEDTLMADTSGTAPSAGRPVLTSSPTVLTRDW